MGHAGQHYVTGRTTIKCPLPSHEFRDEGRVVAVDGPVDTLLYHNLVEMIPLVESLMGQQTSRSFPRHASLVYTPTPPRESWPFKKAVDHSNKGSRASRGLLVPSKGGELRETIFWHNTENMLHGGQNSAEEISMLRFPSNQHTSIATTPCSENIQLHRHVLKLEQKLSEKECQLQATEKTAQQLHIQLNSAITRLQMQLQQKDQAIQNIQNQLFERQLEVVSLQSLMKKSEVNMQASNMKAASLEDELNGLRSQVGALLLLVQSRTPGSIEHPIFEMPPSSEALSMHEGLVIEEPILTKTHAIPTMVDASSMGLEVTDGLKEEHIEVVRKKYEAALTAARNNPSDEMLSLVADLRMQLHTLVMCPSIATSATKEEICWQPLGISLC